MRAKRDSTLLIIDAVGAGAVVLCLSGFVWLTMIRTDAVGQELSASRRMMRTLHHDQTTVHTNIGTQTTALTACREELANSGSLPEVARVEDYFQFLSTAARRRNLRVLRHRPLSSRTYAGLLEQLYTFDVAGSTPNLLAFLTDIERSTYWADVSYLKVQRSMDHDVGHSDRNANLTISMYSNPPQPTGATKGT